MIHFQTRSEAPYNATTSTASIKPAMPGSNFSLPERASICCLLSNKPDKKPPVEVEEDDDSADREEADSEADASGALEVSGSELLSGSLCDGAAELDGAELVGTSELVGASEPVGALDRLKSSELEADELLELLEARGLEDGESVVSDLLSILIQKSSS